MKCYVTEGESRPIPFKNGLSVRFGSDDSGTPILLMKLWVFLQAIQEATGAPVKERLRSLKKQDLAAEAEKSVNGTRWLP